MCSRDEVGQQCFHPPVSRALLWSRNSVDTAVGVIVNMRNGSRIFLICFPLQSILARYMGLYFVTLSA